MKTPAALKALWGHVRALKHLARSVWGDVVYRITNFTSNTMAWDELLAEVEYVRGLYRTHKIPLKQGEGLTAALDEAEALARGTISTSAPTASVVRASTHDAHVVWALSKNLRACVDGGLELVDHLKRITTGTTDYGEPRAPGAAHAIYFKDFECELFIAASLVRGGRAPTFLADAGDPSGELDVDGLRIEVKHPDSGDNLEKLMRKFHSELKKRDLYGVFVVGLEDAFKLADTEVFADVDEFERWKSAKLDAIEAFGRRMLRRAARLPRILGTVQTTTEVQHIGNESRLVRLSNGCLLDIRNGVPEASFAATERVLRVFNPNFRRYSVIKAVVEGPEPPQGGADDADE